MPILDIHRSVAGKISGYRTGQIDLINPEHVMHWSEQFDTQSRPVILNELDRVLGKYYYNRDKVMGSLRGFLLDVRAFGSDPEKTLRATNFLRIQRSGGSQNEMLSIADEILDADFKITTADCGGGNLFVYLDDCVFTGNKFRYDVVPWIQQSEFNQGDRLFTFHIAQHQAGFDYALQYIIAAARQKNLGLKAWYLRALQNRKINGDKIEYLWPKYFKGDPNIDAYYARVREICQQNGWASNSFRTTNPHEETMFSSAGARDIVEQAFLKSGAKLVMAAANPAPSMRPLGFEKLESMGFGSMFMMFRNISNNCPLALWYGDPNASPGTVLGSWYPLMPRRTAGEI